MEKKRTDAIQREQLLRQATPTRITRVGYWRASLVQSIMAATAASILDPIRTLRSRLRRATIGPPRLVRGPRMRRFFSRFGFTR